MQKKIVALLLTFALLGAGPASLGTTAEADAAAGMSVSEDCVKFIEGQEGFSATRYASSSNWYIGYGTGCGATDFPNGITQAEAETLLKNALKSSESAVNSLIAKNGIALRQCQFDALVSFTYNLGAGWMTSSNRIYNCLVGGLANCTDLQIVNAIGTWCHVGTEVNGALVARRLKEANLFLYGDYGDDGSHSYTYLICKAGGGNVEHDIYFYAYGEPYGTLPVATLSGSTFSGWYTNGGAPLNSGDTAEKNLTVYAVWSDSSADTGPYSDVKKSDWYYFYVNSLSADKVVSGYPDGSFRPGSSVSCGEALKLILLAAGNTAPTPTGSHWASGYLDLALSKAYVSAGDITNLDAPISRLLSAQISAKALNISKSDKASPFSDTADGYVTALYGYGIIEGSTENGSLVFRPADCLSRAEMSAIVWRVNSSEIHENQIHYGSYWVNILNSVPVNAYDKTAFVTSNGLMTYKSDTVTSRTGIDVSEYQGNIDWAKVKASGIEFAIIRVGYRGYSTGKIVQDAGFAANIKGAEAAGLKVGVYFFSQAITADEASEEADYVLSCIKGCSLEYPVVFDWEPMGVSTARTDGLSTSVLDGCAGTFCGRITAAGYKPMVYFNAYTGYVKYDLSKIPGVDFWYAEYSEMPSFYYSFQMWQYSSKGLVNGISGNVDMDICFKGY